MAALEAHVSDMDHVAARPRLPTRGNMKEQWLKNVNKPKEVSKTPVALPSPSPNKPSEGTSIDESSNVLPSSPQIPLWRYSNDHIPSCLRHLIQNILGKN